MGVLLFVNHNSQSRGGGLAWQGNCADGSIEHGLLASLLHALEDGKSILDNHLGTCAGKASYLSRNNLTPVERSTSQRTWSIFSRIKQNHSNAQHETPGKNL